MSPRPEGIAPEPLAAGWALLADAEWAGARAAFAAALRREETPAALEGLSWAAWWLDDAEVVFGARERAYRLYRRNGESASAARMATWLAADQLDFRGATAVARGWLRRAARLLEPIEPGLEHGWLAFHEGYLAHLAGDTVATAELGARAVEAGRRLDVPDLEMLGLALQGAALIACARVEEGMRCLDEATATALAGEATLPISGAWACCFLVGACSRVLDCSSIWSTLEWHWERSRRRGPRSRPCGRSCVRSAPSRCARAPTWPRGCWRRRAPSTSGRGRCSRTPSIASRRRARRSRPRGPGSSWR